MRRIGLAVLLTLAQHAFACGYCVEDKMAAVYDHAAVTRALARKHVVAFFHVEGPLDVGAATKRRLEETAEGVAGADRGSARASPESAAISVAFDPQRTSIAGLQAALERRLAVTRNSLMLLQVLDQPADFSPSVARRLRSG